MLYLWLGARRPTTAPLLREKGFPVDFSKKEFPETSKKSSCQILQYKNTTGIGMVNNNRIFNFPQIGTLRIDAVGFTAFSLQTTEIDTQN